MSLRRSCHDTDNVVRRLVRKEPLLSHADRDDRVRDDRLEAHDGLRDRVETGLADRLADHGEHGGRVDRRGVRRADFANDAVGVKSRPVFDSIR